MERCRSGRTGRSRKPLSSLRGTEGSNPSLSASPPFLVVSGCLAAAPDDMAASREVRGVEVPAAKSWVFRFQLDGRRRDIGLGPVPDISLAEARAKATAHWKLRHEGIDPL